MPLTDAMVARNTQLVEKTARPVRASVRERSYSEETITPELSLTVSAVLAAFTILSEDLSSLPLILYQRRGRYKIRAYDSLYYRLMHDQPNPEHSSMVFRELMVGHLLGWGNFYGQPIVDRSGDVQEIWPLRPDRMTVERKEGMRIYTYQTTSGQPRIFIDDEILHIPAFGFDGLIGYSRIALARNAIGLAISTEKFGSKFFSNGANSGVIYKHPGELSDKAYEHLQSSLKERSGVENSNKPVILEEGMSLEKLGIPPDDAQFLETRKFQVSEIARIFRVPPHMIGDVEKTTSWGTGIDSQEQGYVNHTLRPWAIRIEEYLNMRVLLKQDRPSFFYEHLMDALLRGDVATRYEAYVKAINNGIMSPNEVRSRENMNPYKQGDTYWRPANMVSVDDPPSSDTQAANALEPLWRDAIARVMKRESNDVLGASKRYQVKGQQNEFIHWVENFYRHDHMAFMTKQFKPLLDAQLRLFGVDASKQMGVFIFDFLSARLEQLKLMDAEQLSQGMDAYIDSSTRDIMDAVELYLKLVNDDLEMESDYE